VSEDEKARGKAKKPVKSFRELEVYKLAYEAALEVFNLSKKFPKEEMFSLTSQIRGCSRSVCANIGEGWGKRRYPKSFANKLTDSAGEANETSVWLDFSRDHGYITPDTHDDLESRYNHIRAQLYKMVEHSESWCSSVSALSVDG